MTNWTRLPLGAMVWVALAASRGRSLPFTIGETLRYHVQAGRWGGDATLELTDGGMIRGTAVDHLRLQARAGFGPIEATHLTESWLDTLHMAALRFHDRQHRPFSTQESRVEIDPGARAWTASDGTSGETLTAEPLDELSFIYFVRTLDLTTDSVYRSDRFFDAARTPTIVRLLARDSTDVPAGRFATVQVEMIVKDPKQFGDRAGTLRLSLTDDACRLPVQIESIAPDSGRVLFTLTAWSHPASRPQRRDGRVKDAIC